MINPTAEQLFSIAHRFSQGAAVHRVLPHGTGRVNSTYLVETEAAPPHDRFILQQISRNVFPYPERIMANLRCLCNHLRRGPARGVNPRNHWEIPMPIETAEGMDWYEDGNSGFWRGLTFIRNALPLEAVQSGQDAFEAGRALGFFHSMVATLPPDSLFDTLPGFHVTPLYLAAYDKLLEQDVLASGDPAMVSFCSGFIDSRRQDVDLLEYAREEGRAVERVIHGDPKSSNIMINTETGRAVGLVDLDTVKPGLALYDLGDILRSCCNRMGEDSGDLAAVHFDAGLGLAVLQGYLSEAGSLLLPSELDLVADAARLIAFELGLRYFTDHLAGNVYFRTPILAGNLHRALVQFHLVLDIEHQLPELRRMVSTTADKAA